MSQYPAHQAQQDITKTITDYMQQLTRNITGSQVSPPQQQGAQIPIFHCQPVKNLQEVEEMKWFNSTPFVGLTEDGQYIGVRRWDGSIPAASTEYFKRIKPEELPQPPRPVTHEELMELLPAVLTQYIPEVLNQMGVKANEPATSTGGARPDEQLPAVTGGRSKRAMGAESGETGRDK